MSETYDPLQDALRCWYDERDFGLLCDRYPLYAALGKSCLHPDDASRTILDEYTVQLVQEMSHAPVANGWTQHRSDASLFAAADKIDSLFSAEPVNSNSFADVPEAMSITETIALANELKLNNEAISKRLTDGQRQRMKLVQEKLQQQEEQIATLKRQAEAYRQQTIALQSQRAVDHSEAADSSAKTNESTEVSEPNRFGKFKSALQQFTKDVSEPQLISI